MKVYMFGIYDIKAGMYNQPFSMPSRGQALRAFGDLANESETAVGKHPEDYRLMELGSFDDQSGAFESHAVPVMLGSASDYVKASDQVPLPLKAVGDGA